jgi:multidrug resistance efflux pump
MKTDYCIYPPQIAADVEITEQLDGERLVHIVGSASVGRYILLREAEFKVLNLIDGALTPAELCQEFKHRYGASLLLPTLAKFLAKLDDIGILAGERAQGYRPSEQQLSAHFYMRFKLFNPQRIFARLLPPLRWIWTVEFFGFTLFLLLVTTLLALMNWTEVTSYAGYVLREHYLAMFLAGLLVVITHEFAHGMTCTAFGGRATEVGVLLIYYLLPGLYCNVSGLHLIPKRGRRLWVIAAGVYWQLLVGASALLVWFMLAPYTLPADLAFYFFLGSVLNLIFNANPLIKLDGYYFLSQSLRLPNLMDRSRAYWRGLLRRILFGERNPEAARFGRRERAIFGLFGVLSFIYTVGLRVFILIFVGDYLVDSFHLLGLLLTASLAIFYMRRTLRQIISAGAAKMATARIAILRQRTENSMATNDQAAQTSPTPAKSDVTGPSPWRRRLVPLAVALLSVAVLLAPWSASIGNYGTLLAIPGQEAIIRAPESATLIALRASPGEQVTSGVVVGQMGNLELEEQMVQVQSELARAGAEHDRLLGELRMQVEASARAELQLRQRQHEYREIDSERRQIEGQRESDKRPTIETNVRTKRLISASMTLAYSSATDYRSEASAAGYPAAFAVLQSEVEARHARLTEAQTQLARAQKLCAQGLLPRSELDGVETRAATLALELAGAQDRLEAALVEHRRKHTNTNTEVDLARSDLAAAGLQIEKLDLELRSVRALIATLEARRDLIGRKQAQFALTTPQAGTVFGEELPRLVGQYFAKGAEICRVADTRQLLLRIQVPERELGDVRVGHSVRLRARAYPDQVFRGVVSKIGGESEPDQYGQATYRVELTIENDESLLRPGMTAFARIDFGRQAIGRILVHKIKQALRPEMWML